MDLLRIRILLSAITILLEYTYRNMRHAPQWNYNIQNQETWGWACFQHFHWSAVDYICIDLASLDVWRIGSGQWKCSILEMLDGKSSSYLAVQYNRIDPGFFRTRWRSILWYSYLLRRGAIYFITTLVNSLITRLRSWHSCRSNLTHFVDQPYCQSAIAAEPILLQRIPPLRNVLVSGSFISRYFSRTFTTTILKFLQLCHACPIC